MHPSIHLSVRDPRLKIREKVDVLSWKMLWSGSRRAGSDPSEPRLAYTRHNDSQLPTMTLKLKIWVTKSQRVCPLEVMTSPRQPIRPLVLLREETGWRRIYTFCESPSHVTRQIAPIGPVLNCLLVHNPPCLRRNGGLTPGDPGEDKQPET